MRQYFFCAVWAIVSFASTASAEPVVSLNDMPQAVQAADTPFKKCVTQAQLFTERPVTQDVVTTAKRADTAAQQMLISRLTAPANPGSGDGQQAKMSGFAAMLAAAAAQSSSSGSAFQYKLGFGHSATVQSWLQPLNAGDPNLAAQILAFERPTRMVIPKKNKEPAPDDNIAKSIGLLGLIERATVSLSRGDSDCALRYFDFAEIKSEKTQGAFFQRSIKPYEHIMLLNHKAIAYLIAGDERARNMAQASRELQSIERDKYAADLEKAKKEASSDTSASEIVGDPSYLQSFQSAYEASVVASYQGVADRVATPYVNPLADYLSAVISETEASAGLGTRDQWSRASIAWTNASTLAPSTAFMKSAAAQTAQTQKAGRLAPGKKIVNVLVGVGAAPTKIVASTYISYQDQPFPVMLPVTVPTPHQIEGGVVTVAGVSQPLELVSDVEAMAMRQAADERAGDMIGALVRGFIAFKAGQATGTKSNNMFANALGSAIRDTLAEPSTDAWVSLPAAYKAARLVVPANATEVRVDIAGPNGLQTKTFALDPKQATFVYVTAKDAATWGVAQVAAFGTRKVEFQAQ